MIPTLSLVKKCLSTDTTVGDKITYILSCKNEGRLNFEDVILSDLLSPNLQFIRGSLKINNIENSNANIVTGVSIGKLGVGRTTLVSFDVEILYKDLEIIGTTATAEGFYKYNGMTENQITTSMPCVINVNQPSIYIKKTVDKDIVKLDETVSYTIKLVNNGDVHLEYIRLKDDISQSIEVIDGTFSINGNVINGVDLKEGINVGSLNVNDCTLITYDAKIVGKGISCKIDGETSARYGYRLSNGNSGYKYSEVANCELSIALDSFKQVSLNEYINIPPHKSGIDYINNIDTKVIIKEYHPIKTPIATSRDGQVLSGYKLIIHGKISQVIQYTIKKNDQRVHYIEHESIFSSFVVLPCNYKIGDAIQVEGSVEHIYHNLVNSRSLLENIDILLIVKTLR
ncbi:MAG: hypothetical protein ACRC3Y_05570 [Romboutsia sp.]|uniref:hypothetical protein n=1 Tax=Romboutsia sp. TaxID=1965302 RepID=UPI003F31ED9B